MQNDCRINQSLSNSYLTHKYFKELYYSMQGRCDGCGTENVELQQKDVQGQNKNVCANCANQ